MQKSEILKAKVYLSGFCESHQNLALRTAKKEKVPFLALTVYFHIVYQGKPLHILFDTGYADYFFEATKSYPNKIYANITKVTINKTIKEYLKEDGVAKIDYVFISHFHADHIGGLRDFEDAYYVASKDAYVDLIKKNSLASLKHGFLKDLLPKNFNERLIDINSLEKIQSKYGFKEEFLWLDVFKIFNLDGHALGQFGLSFEYKDKEILLVSDAIWDIKNIDENILPSRLANIIFSNPKEFYNTLEILSNVRKANKSTLIVPSHCKTSIDLLIDTLS